MPHDHDSNRFNLVSLEHPDKMGAAPSIAGHGKRNRMRIQRDAMSPRKYEDAHFPTPNLQVQVDSDEDSGLMV